MGGGAHPNERRAAAEANRARKPCLALRVQCGEGGMGRRNSEPIAYRATSGPLV